MRLTTRVSLVFMAALAAVLVGFSTALYLLAASYLSGQADERLEAAANMLAAAAEVNEQGVEWEPEERLLTFGRRAPEGYLRWVVCDGRGRRIDGSGTGLDPLFREALSAWRGGRRPARLADDRGRPWRVLVRRLEAPGTGPGPEPGYYNAIQIGVAVPMEGVQKELRDLAVTLAGLGAAAWLVALVGGLRACRRALRPVIEMADAAHAIGDDPAGRLPSPRTGDELAELARAFNALLDRLHEAHERQRRFTGDASHQLRTPLTAMLGQVELALRRDRPPEEYRRILELVRQRTRHLGRLVDALLFLARADAEALGPDLEVIDLADWLPDHLRSRADAPRAADITLTIGPGGPFPARVQPPLLAELVGNLLDNAARYGHPGTPIEVRLGREAAGSLISVRDFGPGIDPADLPRLFEPFFRGQAATRSGATGVGLGLSVALRLARCFNGMLAARNEPDGGCVFTVHLPRADAPSPTPAGAGAVW